MNSVLALTGSMMLCAVAALADTQGFRSLATTAGKIESSASSLAMDLKGKKTLPDRDALKSRVEEIGKDLEALRASMEELDRAAAANLSAKQREDWERVKIKVQVMGVFHEQKSKLLASEEWNSESKKQLELAAASIAVRAKLLQKTASRL
jgi:hypothetical protein